MYLLLLISPCRHRETREHEPRLRVAPGGKGEGRPDCTGTAAATKTGRTFTIVKPEAGEGWRWPGRGRKRRARPCRATSETLASAVFWQQPFSSAWSCSSTPENAWKHIFAVPPMMLWPHWGHRCISAERWRPGCLTKTSDKNACQYIVLTLYCAHRRKDHAFRTAHKNRTY